ncbi:5-(carboxyamino)imidazole ribonucleotide synthase [Salarchaeum japonicum]|uniref:N5-carboxyaminoimidazole ribonucleotide synthase n=1 Tax=Salarchaeum japonicum TaxID=555573 RepID=A0AAV3T2D9_9EURY|nr:5-(carboxyamino)imidazole ribonucleotide synthase [Salarchaeum japonicum]
MDSLVPGGTLGVVGGGQLGRMLAEAASPLGVDVVVLDPTPDCPACPPAADQLVADFDDPDALASLAERADVVTYEIELADADALESLDAPVHPAPDSLRTTGDKLAEKRALADAGLPVPAFREVHAETDLRDAFDDLGSPLMLKARRGGYDGRGNHVAATVSDAVGYFDDLTGLVAEELVDFERELSVIGVRGDDERDAFPVVENVHEDEILRETIAPARTDDQTVERAREVALDVLDALDGRGVFGIELFELDGDVLVNEIAPRPHNSGHYTIEGAHTSQFEQHVRAVLGLPLGSTELRGPTAMANLLGSGAERPASLAGADDALSVATAALHWYGKAQVRPLRKMGHVTASGDDTDTALTRARTARDALDFQ